MAFGRLKESITLSPIAGDCVVPFSKIADPTKAAMLTEALHEICRQAGLEPGSPECAAAAGFIMRLYWEGHHTVEGLRAALSARYELETGLWV
jgi:hypothetical protein